MKPILVPSLHIPENTTSFSVLASYLADVPTHTISHVNWPQEYPYKPEVTFKIAYTATHLYLQYQVQEELVRANYMRPNENVWEDSCVEFFLSFDQKKTYYNLEFNVLGTGLIGYGSADKKTRQRMDSATIEQVTTFTEVVQRNGQKLWSLFLEIPLTVFKFEADTTLKGKTLQANFYKCGDHLPKPHFISWSPIDYPTPNFHQPQFFGDLTFDS